MSPTSLKLTLEQIKSGKLIQNKNNNGTQEEQKKKVLKECLEMEYRMIMRCMKSGDFEEGVRALLVDKVNKYIGQYKSIMCMWHNLFWLLYFKSNI
jgi:hypothetical protein